MSRLKDYMESSEGSGREMYGETFRKAYEKDYQGINPKKQARDRRILNEALIFLQNQESIKNPESTLKALFAMYEEIDAKADYIKPGEREFFPMDKSLRTIERFLEGFRYIYFILRRAQDRLYLTNVFDNFWEKCKKYLRRCGYSEKFITRVCAKDSLFYMQSFNFWRGEYGDFEEAFSIMYKYFKSCFGISGNYEYCRYVNEQGETYNWTKMKNCHEKFNEKQFYINPTLEPTNYVPPSKEQLDNLRELIKTRRNELAKRNVVDTLLLEIQRRNKERGYFQNI